jgi:hypothetical protein
MVTSAEGSVAWLQTFALSGLRYHDHDDVCFDWNLVAFIGIPLAIELKPVTSSCHEGHIMGSNA